MSREVWDLIHVPTGRPLSLSSFPSKEEAERYRIAFATAGRKSIRRKAEESEPRRRT